MCLVLFVFKNSLLGYTEQYVEYDPFLTPPDPSNPWISDDTTLWELEARWVHATKECLNKCIIKTPQLGGLCSILKSCSLLQ